MLKDLKIVLAFVLAFTLSSTVYVRAEENNEGHSVSTFVELKAAADQKVASITLENDIIVEEPILFLNDVVIEGNNHTLKVNKTKTEWESLYILKFHRVNATLSNVQLDGGDAALLVNNSRLTLNGSITLRNQAFGGIELTHGKTAQKDPVSLSTLNATLANESEEKGKPTVWSDLIDTYQIDNEHFIKRDDLVENQNHYYLADPDAVVPVTVTTYEQFKEALANKSEHIILGADLEFIEKVNVTYPVIIDGNNHTISGVNTEGWTGFYLLQFYKTEAVLSNITLTNADAGILVNGSSLTLLGDVDLSGNEFGGVEVSRGKNVNEVSKLNVREAVLKNDTEDFGQPTIWIDGIEEVEVLHDGLYVRSDVKENQIHYYLNKTLRREVIVTEIALETFKNMDLEGFEIEIDSESRSVIIRKVSEDAVITRDEVVDSLVMAIMSNDNIQGFVINGKAHQNYDEAYVREVVEEMLDIIIEHQPELLESFDNLQVALRFNVVYENQVVPTEDIDVTYEEANTNEEVPVTPEKPSEKDPSPKEGKTETPKTGLMNEEMMYLSLMLIGALLLIFSKYKKRYY